MEIKIEMDQEIIIIKLSGELVASSVEMLKGQAAKLIEKKYTYLLLDLGRVEFVDSTGLGTCISLSRSLTMEQGALACTGLRDAVLHLFHMTRADQKIPVYANRTDAVLALTEMARCSPAKTQVGNTSSLLRN